MFSFDVYSSRLHSLLAERSQIPSADFYLAMLELLRDLQDNIQELSQMPERKEELLLFRKAEKEFPVSDNLLHDPYEIVPFLTFLFNLSEGSLTPIESRELSAHLNYIAIIADQGTGGLCEDLVAHIGDNLRSRGAGNLLASRKRKRDSDESRLSWAIVNLLSEAASSFGHSTTSWHPSYFQQVVETIKKAEKISRRLSPRE